MAKGNPLRRLVDEHPEIGAFIEAHNEIHFGSDRAAAILVAAALEQYLRAMILLYLPNRDGDTSEKLLGNGGALSSFYNNIHLAYAMGLIDTITKEDLNTIRNVRNVFAHAMGHVSFETLEIKQECERLKTTAEYKIPTLDTTQAAPLNRQRYIAVSENITWKIFTKASEQMNEDGSTAES